MVLKDGSCSRGANAGRNTTKLAPFPDQVLFFGKGCFISKSIRVFNKLLNDGTSIQLRQEGTESIPRPSIHGRNNNNATFMC